MQRGRLPNVFFSPSGATNWNVKTWLFEWMSHTDTNHTETGIYSVNRQNKSRTEPYWIGPVWSHEDGSSTSLLCVCVNCDCFRLFTDVQPSGSNSVSWTEAPTHFVLRCYSNAVIKFQSVSAGSQERHFIYCLQVTPLRKEKKKPKKLQNTVYIYPNPLGKNWHWTRMSGTHARSAVRMTDGFTVA